MQVLGHLGNSVCWTWCRIAHNVISKKITVYLSASISSLLILSNLQLPNVHAHVSHVLPVQQYVDIKSGYPDIELTATLVTGLIVILAILAQSFQRHRRTLNTC